MPNMSHQTYRMYSPSLDAMMREVLHTLGDIDFAAEVELENVEVSARDPKLNEHLKSKIRAAHWERRQPTWTCWKRCGGNSTASPSLPKGVNADRLACSTVAQRLHSHRLGAQKSRPGGSASAASSYGHPLFGTGMVASIIHHSNRNEEQ